MMILRSFFGTHRVCSFSLLHGLLNRFFFSNFDQFLKAKDPSYGVRNLEDVIEEAKKQGLVFVEKIEMPANNLSVIFRKQ